MHPTSDEDFILEAMDHVAKRYDNFLERVADVFDEDPLAALRLLQVCGIHSFGHIFSANRPESSATFCAQRDATITEAFGVLHGFL